MSHSSLPKKQRYIGRLSLGACLPRLNNSNGLLQYGYMRTAVSTKTRHTRRRHVATDVRASRKISTRTCHMIDPSIHHSGGLRHPLTNHATSHHIRPHGMAWHDGMLHSLLAYDGTPSPVQTRRMRDAVNMRVNTLPATPTTKHSSFSGNVSILYFERLNPSQDCNTTIPYDLIIFLSWRFPPQTRVKGCSVRTATLPAYFRVILGKVKVYKLQSQAQPHQPAIL